MLLDLLRTDNYASYNIKLSHVLGLEESVYVNQIINIMGKAIKKDKINDDGYVKLDRTYIFNQTTLTLEEQLKIDSKLLGIGLMKRDFENPDLLKIDTEMLASITSCDDSSQIEQLVAKIPTPKISKSTKDYYNIEKLKKYITTDNEELYSALFGWLDVLVREKKMFLNYQLISKFQNDLYTYTKGDLDKALEIVATATMYGYRDCGWAINMYEQNRINGKVIQQPKEVATKDTISNMEY